MVAVNPITNRIYVANEFSNTVTAIDGATNAMTAIPVGTRPQHELLLSALREILI